MVCNEEFKLSEGPECKIEVKCYHEDIDGSLCWVDDWDANTGPYYSAEYYFDYTYDVYMGTNTIPVCAGLVYAPIGFAPNTKYHCTENAKGKNFEGDVAVEIEIKLGGCFPD